MKIPRTKAFTLIELLVVISIIGLLVAIILPSFTTARKTSRVGQRVTNMKQVQAALEFYYAANHSYPNTSGVWRGDCPTYGAYSPNNTIPGLAPLYIAAIPVDPQSDPSSDNNCYLYKSDGTNWAFLDYFVSEMYVNQSLPNYSSYPELIDPVRVINGFPYAWKVSSPGAVAW